MEIFYVYKSHMNLKSVHLGNLLSKTQVHKTCGQSSFDLLFIS